MYNMLYVSDAAAPEAQLVAMALEAKGFEYGRCDQALFIHTREVLVELDTVAAVLQYLDKLRPEPALLPHLPLDYAAAMRIVECALRGEDLHALEQRLKTDDFVLGPQPSIADLAMHVTTWQDLALRAQHLARCMEAFEEWRDPIE